MCKSKLEGGWRCYSHMSKEYAKAEEKIAAAEKELQRKHNVMSQINYRIREIESQSPEEVVDVDYTKEMYRMNVEQRKRGEVYIHNDEQNLEILRTESKKALAEMYTTAKGLKILKDRIRDENDPVMKKTLQIQYNASSRINENRKEAFKRHKQNLAEAAVLTEQADEKRAEHDAIVVASPDHAKLKEELRVEAKMLYAQAHLKKNNGNTEVQALFDSKTGEIMPYKFVDGKFGKTWAKLSDPKNPSSRPESFLSPPRGKTYESRRSFYEAKGLVLGTVWVPGKTLLVEDEYGNKDVNVGRSDGGFSRFCINGSPDVYADKIRENKSKEK